LTGSYHQQHHDALEWTNTTLREIQGDPRFADYTISTTGHSLGGGHAQVMADTFGLDGISLDAPQASAILESEGYEQQLQELGITAREAGNFINFNESGSLVSNVPFREYTGRESTLELRPDGLQITSIGGLLFPATRPFAVLLGGYDLANQHSSANFAAHFSVEHDPEFIDGYHFVSGEGFERKGVTS